MLALSKVEEEVLGAIITHYEKNESNFFRAKYEIFPQYVLNNLGQYLELLKSKSIRCHLQKRNGDNLMLAKIRVSFKIGVNA